MKDKVKICENVSRNKLIHKNVWGEINNDQGEVTIEIEEI